MQTVFERPELSMIDHQPQKANFNHSRTVWVIPFVLNHPHGKLQNINKMNPFDSRKIDRQSM